MTRVYGFAANPNPVAGVLVYASLIPEKSLPPPPVGNVYEDTTDAQGRWELDLQPTADTPNVYWRIRVWQYGTFWVDVPQSSEPVSVDDILVRAPAPSEPPPEVPGTFVLRSELAKPGGVATLDTDGLLTKSQRPPGGDGETVDWFFGDGPPTVVPGAGLNDLYVDRLTGDVYKLT